MTCQHCGVRIAYDPALGRWAATHIIVRLWCPKSPTHRHNPGA